MDLAYLSILQAYVKTKQTRNKGEKCYRSASGTD